MRSLQASGSTRPVRAAAWSGWSARLAWLAWSAASGVMRAHRQATVPRSAVGGAHSAYPGASHAPDGTHSVGDVLMPPGCHATRAGGRFVQDGRAAWWWDWPHEKDSRL